MARHLVAWPNQLDQLILPAQDGERSRQHKRSRVASACERCKTRKQKCDGRRPCSRCETSKAFCKYLAPQKPTALGKNQYIGMLERRVAELETILATQGMAGPSDDHWEEPSLGPITPEMTEAPPHNEARSMSSPDHSRDMDVDNIGDADADADAADNAVLDWRSAVDPVVSVLRSLSMDVNGAGLVGSSHLVVGRLFSSMSRARNTADSTPNHSRENTSSTSSAASHRRAQSLSETDLPPPIDLADVPSDTADRLFRGYLQHIATRFPVIHSVKARRFHDRRHSLCDVFEITLLHLIYATAGRFIETTGETGQLFHAKRHYATALRELDTLLIYNDLRTAQALILMAVYCLRDPGGPGAWAYSRTALLVAIDHGLHRRTTKPLAQPSLKNELRKRLFWTCYAFDRQISIPTGRPFGISDRDINVDLPLDIDEHADEDAFACKNLPLAKDGAESGSTSLTSFILVVRIRQIESDIQQNIYRVDKDVLPIQDAVIDEYLARIDAWKDMIPQDTQRYVDSGDAPYNGYEFYMVYYYKCQRLLLYPLISDPAGAPRFLQKCAAACAGICGAYKRLHQSFAVGYSVMALQTIFIAGLTLVYCIWISPDEIYDLATSSGIHDCSIMLFVIAERVPSTKKYRNTFEVVRQKVIQQISRPVNRRPREAVPGLTTELAQPANSFELDKLFEMDNEGFELFSQIITEMTGEEFMLPVEALAGDGLDVSSM